MARLPRYVIPGQPQDKWVRHHFPPDLYKWIDQFEAAILKILGVSGGYSKPVGEGDAGNLPVGQAHGASCFLATW